MTAKFGALTYLMFQLNNRNIVCKAMFDCCDCQTAPDLTALTLLLQC